MRSFYIDLLFSWEPPPPPHPESRLSTRTKSGITSLVSGIHPTSPLCVQQYPVHALTVSPPTAQFASRQGFSLGPLINLVLRVDPAILVTALLATTTVFVCFAGTALFAKRRSYLYLGGVLSSGLIGERGGRGCCRCCRCLFLT